MSMLTPPSPKRCYEIAHAAGQDAGNRAMRAGGRSRWSRADYQAACAEMNRLLDTFTSAS